MDDIIILNHKEHHKEVDEVTELLKKTYKFHNMGDLKWFLGICVTRDHPNQKVYLTQDSYIDKIVKDYTLNDGLCVYTPLSKDSASAYIPYEGKATDKEIKSFQHCVGSIMYPACMTRPDIAQAVSLLAHFMQNPSPFHSTEADQVICYLRDTKDLSLVYDGISMDSGPSSKASHETKLNKKVTFEAFSDTAFTDNLDTCHSSEGYLFKLFGAPVEWRAVHQDTVTTSTTEAELLTLSHAGTQAHWWQQFFKQLGFNPGHRLSLQTDNQMAAGICTKAKPNISTKLKHVDIHQHWLWERVQEGVLDISWISTMAMPADSLTKPLGYQKHQHFVQLLGLTRCKLP